MKKERLRIIVEENKEAFSQKGARLFEQKALESVEKEGHSFRRHNAQRDAQKPCFPGLHPLAGGSHFLGG